MFENGWIRETEQTLAMGYSQESPAFEGLGYREIILFINGKIKYNEMKETIKMETRRYAKRQLTWFSHQLKSGKIKTINS